ncbi:hypothetical protein ANN_06274 [Periplaneta americana]|uniref:Uncharacterized protein n=1 Tax=Periplaneta americana TaxID=6978 RepID=A0ABQ8TFE2_PERAM|nr:hypothetical protein ANN_06274 [Periplaneta americana]
MSPGSSTESYPAFAHIGLRENPGKRPQSGKHCYGAGYRSRDLWLNVPALYQLSYPETPPDTASIFPVISTQLEWADKTPETHIDCETLTLTLREEQRLRVFENKVLSKIFGAKRDEVTGEWRKLHNATARIVFFT